MSIETDKQFEEHKLTGVRKSEKGWEITHDGWTMFMDECGITPKVGDVARYYGKGIGFTVRGLMINGRVAFYRTEAEENARHEQWCRDQEAKRQEDFAKNRPQMDADYAALPAEFQRRLDRFRRNNSSFRWQHEPYELMVCKDAVLIAKTLESGPAIKAFHGKPWAEQIKDGCHPADYQEPKPTTKGVRNASSR